MTTGSGDRGVTSIARKVVIGVLGLAVLSAGIVLLALPGPGLLVIVLGLAILSLEFPWARRAERWARGQASRAASGARARMRARSRRRRLADEEAKGKRLGGR